MCINVACRADVAVPQPLLNLLQAHAIGIEQTGAAMAQIVKADTLHLVCDQKIREMLAQEIGPNPFSHRVYIRRLAFVPPYFVFCSISFRCGGLSIERNQKPLAPKITLVATHHDRQKQVEVKRSSCVNPHEIRLFSGCPYAVVK